MMGDLKGYFNRLDLTEARVKKQVTNTYRKLVEAIFTDIVKHTPQFTGNLVQGWQIVFGPYSATQLQTYSNAERNSKLRAAYAGEFEPYSRGDDPAVTATLERELSKLSDLRYNSTVRIVNNTPYAEAVDTGMAPGGSQIRPENLYYGKVFMTTYAAMKYNRMKNLIKVTA